MPRDLSQSPGDIVVLSAADTELSLLANAHKTRTTQDSSGSAHPTSILPLKHNFSVDLYLEKTLAKARIVILRPLGGRSYWPYGLDRLKAAADVGKFQFVCLPGDDKPDATLEQLSTVSEEARS